MWRYLLPLGIFCILTGFLYVGLGLNPRDIGTTRLDKPLPTFTLPRLEDSHKTLSNQDLLNQVALFNVWASWCVSCRYEHPLLLQLAKTVSIYGLNYKDDPAAARSVLAKTGSPYVANAVDESGRVGMDWGVTGTPETFVIDKQGIVRYKHTGPLNANVWQEQILPLIQQLERN